DEAIPWGNAEEIASFMLAMTLLDRRRSLSRSAPRDDISCPCHGEEARSADEAIPWGNAEEIASFMLAMTLLDRRRSLSRSAPRDDIERGLEMTIRYAGSKRRRYEW
ncbi:hypothetical protein, partial [Candidatus Solincola sp.]